MMLHVHVGILNVFYPSQFVSSSPMTSLAASIKLHEQHLLCLQDDSPDGLSLFLVFSQGTVESSCHFRYTLPLANSQLL